MSWCRRKLLPTSPRNEQRAGLRRERTRAKSSAHSLLSDICRAGTDCGGGAYLGGKRCHFSPHIGRPTFLFVSPPVRERFGPMAVSPALRPAFLFGPYRCARL